MKAVWWFVTLRRVSTVVFSPFVSITLKLNLHTTVLSIKHVQTKTRRRNFNTSLKYVDIYIPGQIGGGCIQSEELIAMK
jgi:hypothetical protein